MPYSGPDDASLPDNVKKMSADSRKKWVEVWNNSYKNCRDKNTGGGEGSSDNCEATAFKFANAAVKEITREKCMDYGAVAYGRRAEQDIAEYGPLAGSDQKACANCLFFISPNSCTVVFDDYPLAISPTGLCKFWTEIPEYRPEPMEVVIVEGTADRSLVEALDNVEAEKAVTKTEGGTEFSASDYAVVPDPEKPSTWKLRLAEGSSGNFTVAQVGRAITAMQPGGFRGNQVELSGEEKKQAISKISAAIGKVGDDAQKENLRERLDKVKEVGVINRVIDWLKSLLRSEPEMESFRLVKQLDGSYRWFSWVTNHFRDRDNPPEIFESKAHREFVSYLDNGGTMPQLWLWHTPGTKCGQADWVDFADGFLMVSGTVDAGKESWAENLSKMKSLGVSHGYKCRYSDPDNGIIGWYRTLEISPLPAAMAANPWTGMEVVRQEVKEMFGPEKRPFLVGVMGEEAVAALEGQTESMGKALEDLGIEHKEVEGETTSPADVLADILAKAIKIPTASENAQAILESEGFKTMSAMVEDLKVKTDQIPGILDRLKALEKSEDEKVAALVGAPSVQVAGYKASEAEDNKVDPEEAKKAGPVLPNEFMRFVFGGAPTDGARAE